MNDLDSPLKVAYVYVELLCLAQVLERCGASVKGRKERLFGRNFDIII